MSDNWRKGDLALCVNADRIEVDDWIWTGTGLIKGRCYKVEGVFHEVEDGQLLLALLDDPFSDDGRLALRFRKIKPLSKSEYEQFLMDLDEPVSVRERV